MACINKLHDQDADSPHYLVEFTEPALMEADSAYLWLSGLVGPESAFLWYEGLFLAAQILSTLPRAHAIAPEDAFYDVEVRRLIYHGPSRRRGRNVYRFLFHIIESQEDKSEGVVRILHVWHGAKGPSSWSAPCWLLPITTL